MIQSLGSPIVNSIFLPKLLYSGNKVPSEMQKTFLPDANRQFYFYSLTIFILRIGCFKNADQMISFCQPAVFQMHSEWYNFARRILSLGKPDTFQLAPATFSK